MSSSMTQQQAARPSHQTGAGTGIYLGFIPWVLFTLVANHESLWVASVTGFAGAAVVSLLSVLKGRPKVLEMSAMVAFAAFAVVGMVADPATSEWVVRYARAIAAGCLALIAFGSLLITPFTEQYARDSVPQRLWDSTAFKRVNRRLTGLWGAVFTAMVVSHLVAGVVDTHRFDVIFNWAVPVLLIVWAAKQTAAVAGAVDAD